MYWNVHKIVSFFGHKQSFSDNFVVRLFFAFLHMGSKVAQSGSYWDFVLQNYALELILFKGTHQHVKIASFLRKLKAEKRNIDVKSQKVNYCSFP
jgi:hypothetical protein